jgi:hypothetical protein
MPHDRPRRGCKLYINHLKHEVQQINKRKPFPSHRKHAKSLLQTQNSKYYSIAFWRWYINLNSLTQYHVPVLFWDITQRRVVMLYGRVGSTKTSQHQGSRSPLKIGPIGCPETSVKDYRSTLRNIPEERRSHQHRGGKLKSEYCTGYKQKNGAVSMVNKGKPHHYFVYTLYILRII